MKSFGKQIAGVREELRGGNFAAVLARSSDLLLVAGIVLIVGLMIVPLPTFLLDIFITLNIAVAITMVMISVYVTSGAQLVSFPTILLLTTLYRLALEVSSTRLILLQADAGDVIKAFGTFVVGGNFVVGAVIFIILTLVQFIVITKGSERVAEVSARFTLDALPGKQMSIDADLRAGSIDFKVARSRRQTLAKESQFYGAMDGAMKFVKGDAIAGIIITVINIVGGLIIGVTMNGMSASDAAQTYSILTIGDGLVAQIPALLLSISAGMVVTRIASEEDKGNLGSDIADQVLAHPKAIGIVSFVLIVLGLLPGMPKIAFFLLAVVTGGISYGLRQATRLKAEAAQKALSTEQKIVARTPDPGIAKTLPVIFELGGELKVLTLLDTPRGKQFFSKLMELREILYAQLGVIFPPLRVDQCRAPLEGDNNYRIWLDEAPVVTGRISPNLLLVNSEAQQLKQYGIAAEPARNPVNYKPAAWIDQKNLEQITASGIQYWGTDDIVLMQINAFLRTHAADFIGLQEVQWMVEEIRKHYPTLVEETVPKLVSLQQLTLILQRLLRERVSIKDMRTILHAIGAWSGVDGSDPAILTERARTALSRRICFGLSNGRSKLLVYQLDPALEDLIRDALRQGPTGIFLALGEEQQQLLIEAVRSSIPQSLTRTQSPVLVVDDSIRPYVVAALGRAFPELHALGYAEIAPEIWVEPLGVVSLPAQEVEEDEPAFA